MLRLGVDNYFAVCFEVFEFKMVADGIFIFCKITLIGIRHINYGKVVQISIYHSTFFILQPLNYKNRNCQKMLSSDHSCSAKKMFKSHSCPSFRLKVDSDNYLTSTDAED